MQGFRTTNSWVRVRTAVQQSLFDAGGLVIDNEIADKMLARWLFDVMDTNSFEHMAWWETLDEWLLDKKRAAAAEHTVEALNRVLAGVIKIFPRKAKCAGWLRQMADFFGSQRGDRTAAPHKSVPLYFQFIKTLQLLIWKHLPVVCFIGGHASGDMFGIGASALLKRDMGIVVHEYRVEGQDHSDTMVTFFESLIGERRVRHARLDKKVSNEDRRQTLIVAALWKQVFTLMENVGAFCWLAPYNFGTYYLSARFSDTDGSLRQRIRRGFRVDVTTFDDRIVKFLAARTVPIEQLSRRRVLVLWSRFSGKKGEYHPEHDTSFTGMAQLAWAATEMGYHVIIAGDRPVLHTMVKDRVGRANKYDSICLAIAAYYGEPRCFNLTEFWSQEGWRSIGASRIAQFQIYEILHRLCDTRHLGMRSGNMEALALLGYFVRYMEESGSWGGARMEAWHGSDIGYERILLGAPPTRTGKFLMQDRRSLAWIPSHITSRNRGVPGTSSKLERTADGEFDARLPKLLNTFRSRPSIQGHQFGHEVSTDLFVVFELAQRLSSVVHIHTDILEPMAKPGEIEVLAKGFTDGDLRLIASALLVRDNPCGKSIPLDLGYAPEIQSSQVTHALAGHEAQATILLGVRRVLLEHLEGKRIELERQRLERESLPQRARNIERGLRETGSARTRDVPQEALELARTHPGLRYRGKK